MRANSGNEFPLSENIFDVAAKLSELADLDRQSEAPGFWDDTERAQASRQKASRLKEATDPVVNLGGRLDDIIELADMAASEVSEAEAEALVADFAADLGTIDSELAQLELETLLSGEYDENNAILEVNAGAGGTESCDWAQMLLRMYMRWAQDHGFKAELADEVAGDVAGIRNATIEVSGRYAYGYLKAERGVHRLVRISPFDANKRRHTSFASVDVIPETAADTDVDINPDEIRIDTYRSSGAGGQHVNKTDSAVRITHIPTGIVVSCQNERSQHKNRDLAMKVLRARLLEVQRREHAAKVDGLRGEQQANEWGSQIRSYVFQPYTMVKDLRTQCETGDVIKVMDGGIQPFLLAYLQWEGRRD